MNLQQHNISDIISNSASNVRFVRFIVRIAAVNPDYPGPKQAGPDGERLRLKKFGFYDRDLEILYQLQAV